GACRGASRPSYCLGLFSELAIAWPRLTIADWSTGRGRSRSLRVPSPGGRESGREASVGCDGGAAGDDRFHAERGEAEALRLRRSAPGDLCRLGRTDRGLRTGRAASRLCRALEGRAWQEDRILVADGRMIAVLPENHSATRWKHGGSTRGKTAAQF